MKKFKTITSHVLPLLEEDVDTDQIIPGRFLKLTTREGFGDKLFRDWRYGEDGKVLESPFNDPFYQRARILLTKPSFGIGSSREHAVWALYDFGFRAIIGSEFGDIFYTNALKNGLLIIKLTKIETDELFNLVRIEPQTKITVKLDKQWVVTESKKVYEFDIKSFNKQCLLKGYDELKYILSLEKYITNYEATKLQSVIK